MLKLRHAIASDQAIVNPRRFSALAQVSLRFAAAFRIDDDSLSGIGTRGLGEPP
jgi:hypothetical protein